MTVEIWCERPEDFSSVEKLTRDAFWNQYAPGCIEHYLTHILRDCSAFIPELDLIAEADGVPAGSLIAVKGVIVCDSGKRREVVTLGPLAVAPAFQRQGIGGMLLAAVKQEAQAHGYDALFLCGDPAYYCRHGFVPAEDFGIRTAENNYAAALQVCELRAGALHDAAGCYSEDSSYQVDEAAAEAFDRQFPPLEKRGGTPGQERFLELVSMQRCKAD